MEYFLLYTTCMYIIHMLECCQQRSVIVRGMVFPVIIYRCESWTIKKAECQRTGAFKLWCWRRLLGVPWTARRSNQSIPKEINPGYSLEGLMLKLKFNTLAPWWEELINWKRPWCWERLKAGGEGDNRGWNGWIHNWMDGHEFEQALGVGDICICMCVYVCVCIYIYKYIYIFNWILYFAAQ